METTNKWYRADFTAKGLLDNTDINSEYYMAESDAEAIDRGKELASKGADFTDIGHVEIELTYISEVDDTQETWPEKRTVYY
jgi:hypothetical protein